VGTGVRVEVQGWVRGYQEIVLGSGPGLGGILLRRQGGLAVEYRGLVI